MWIRFPNSCFVLISVFTFSFIFKATLGILFDFILKICQYTFLLFVTFTSNIFIFKSTIALVISHSLSAPFIHARFPLLQVNMSVQ
jgi:hypothetical protein